MSRKQDLTLLLVGKTGNGKSSTGNTILHTGTLEDTVDSQTPRSFAVAHSLNSATSTSEKETCLRDGRRITVINTPDLANPTDKAKAVDKNAKVAESHKEVEQWKDMTNSGNPDAVLLVVCCDRRYTREEHEIYTQLRGLLKREMKINMKEKLVVIFTMGGSLNGRDLQLDLSEACEELKDVLKDAGQRYVVFDNKADDVSKAACVNTLLDVVQTMKPHPFPQQVCRLLVLGDREKVELVVTTLIGSQPLSQPVQLLTGTTEDGLRLEVTVVSDEQLRKNSLKIQTSASPGPHAILLLLDHPEENAHFFDNLEKTLGTPLQKTPIAQFVVFVLCKAGSDGTESNIEQKLKENKSLRAFIPKTGLLESAVLKHNDLESRKSLLTATEKGVRQNAARFYQTREMLHKAEEVQQKIDNSQATYADYLKTKQSMLMKLEKK